MFAEPAGWVKSVKSSGVILYDAPDLKPGQECRIAVLPPSPTKGSFEVWFAMVREPMDIVKESDVINGTGAGGTRTLRITLSIGGRRPMYRVYHGIQDQNRCALVLITAWDESVYKSHLPVFDSLTASWDPKGRFPTTAPVALAK